jgi:hypothetical protein
MSSIYVTYLTIYSGLAMPPFYIGSTSLKKIEKGYVGSVASRQFRDIWKRERVENPSCFDVLILSEHSTRAAALSEEKVLHERLDVVRSPLFINMSIAGVHPKNSGKGRPMSERTRSALTQSRLGVKHSEEAKQKMREAWKKRAPLSDIAIANIKAGAKKRPPVSEETRAKLSASVKMARSKKPCGTAEEAR